MPLREAVLRVARVLDRRPLYVRLPRWTHLLIAWLAERVMREPKASLAQVRILAEGVIEAAAGAEPLPADPKPRGAFTETAVRAGLPAAGRYGLRDLRCCLCA